MNIAIIPARGGSKRIPRKNIKLFYGKPMIAWSIEAAINSKLFEKIVVSTDDSEIAEIARRYGAVVPFVRPSGLADDITPTVPVVAHALSELAELGIFATFVCCIYPCAPFVRTSDLIDSLDLLRVSEANFVYPIAEYLHPVQRALVRGQNGVMQFLHPKYEMTRTQDIQKAFHDAGQFYWGRSESWILQKKMHSEGIGFEIPSWRVVDIDTADDWIRAELLFKLMA